MMPRWQRFVLGLILALGLAVTSAGVGGFIGGRIYDGPSGFDAIAYMLGALMIGGLVGLAIGIVVALRARPALLKGGAAAFGVIGLVLVLLVANARYREMEKGRQELVPPGPPTKPAEPAAPSAPAEALEQDDPTGSRDGGSAEPTGTAAPDG